MSKRHARRMAKNVNPSKPRWRKEGRVLQRDLAQVTKERDEARASDSSARDALDLLREQLATIEAATPVVPANPQQDDS